MLMLTLVFPGWSPSLLTLSLSSLVSGGDAPARILV